MNNNSQSLILVDGTSYIFRAFYALPPLTNKDGHPTGAISGFAQMLHKLFQDYPNAPVVVFFDASGPTHRSSWYSEYKANRKSPPEDLIKQIEPIKDIVRAMGIPLVSYQGTEADDLIACVAREYQKHGEVIVCSPDKDFCQLVTDRIILENPIDRTRLSPQSVFVKYGVTVEQLPEYFALIGDSSDNIPGVPKIGPKTAQTLISQYGSLEGVYQHIGDLKGSVANNLICYKDNAFLSRRLFLFQTLENLFWPKELPFDVWPAPLTVNILEAAKLYEKYELKRLLSKLPAPKEERAPYPEVDLEWNAILPARSQVFVVYQEEGVWEVGSLLAQGSWAKGVFSADLLQKFLQGNSTVTAIAWDWKALMKKGAILPKIYSDLWIVCHLTEPDKKWEFVPLREEQSWATSATMAAFALYREKMSMLSPLQIQLLDTIEAPLIPILFEMEKTGVLINKEGLLSLDRQWNTDLERLKGQAQILVGREFNLNSSKQLREILFEERGLKSTIKTPKGELSTNEEALAELKGQDPLVEVILSYRHYEKLRSTYTAAWLERLQSQNRLHTTYDQGGTVTGRLSSLDPNLQNIPVRSSEGKQIRQTIIAPPGFKLVSFDYSQIELRLMAHFSQDRVLMEAYEKGLDLHAQTASILCSVPISQVTENQRSLAKTVNFGLIYGMSAFGLAKQLGLSNAEAAHLIEQYFLTYKGVFEYMNAVKLESKKQGFVQTLMGRQIPIRPSMQKGGGDNSWRAAINGPLQGTASELIKKAMIDLQPSIAAHDGVKMIMQVHDELVFEVPEDLVQEWAPRAIAIMEQAMTLRVPLVVNYSVGSFWE